MRPVLGFWLRSLCGPVVVTTFTSHFVVVPLPEAAPAALLGLGLRARRR